MRPSSRPVLRWCALIGLLCALAAPARAQPPANDICGQNVSQFTIPPNTGMVTGTLLGATRDALSTSCPVVNQSGADVYHYLTPAVTGIFTIETCGLAAFDTTLTVFTNTCPVSIATEVPGGCNDDWPFCIPQSRLSVQLSAGQTYIVRVGTYEATTIGDAYSLRITFVQQAPNDDCGPTNPLLALDTPVSSNNSGATTSITLTPASLCGTSPGAGGGADVFYRFVPPVPGAYIFSTCGSVLDTVLSVHSGCPVSETNLVACNDDAGTVTCPTSGLNSQVLTTLLPSATYFVRVAGWRLGGAAGVPRTGAFTLLVRRDPAAAPIGACCIAGVCSFKSPAECTGDYRGHNAPCSPDPCAPPPGACCWFTGGCSLVAFTMCNGVHFAGATACSTSLCPQVTGACCIGATCSNRPPALCVAPAPGIGALFVGAPPCGFGSSSTVPCCIADFNKVNGVNVADIFAFLGAWFAGSPFAHLPGDGTGVPVVQDIFQFLTAWFAGGC